MLDTHPFLAAGTPGAIPVHPLFEAEVEAFVAARRPAVRALAEESGEYGGSGILVTGSVVLVGDARRLLARLPGVARVGSQRAPRLSEVVRSLPVMAKRVPSKSLPRAAPSPPETNTLACALLRFQRRTR